MTWRICHFCVAFQYFCTQSDGITNSHAIIIDFWLRSHLRNTNNMFQPFCSCLWRNLLFYMCIKQTDSKRRSSHADVPTNTSSLDWALLPLSKCVHDIGFLLFNIYAIGFAFGMNELRNKYIITNTRTIS